MTQDQTFSEEDQRLFEIVRKTSPSIAHLNDASLAKIRFEQPIRWQALLSEIQNMTS